MCILCGIQKWSRRVATMLPWLVIPLIGLWALSQLLPPAFRFEITSPRLACVFVLLITLFWYEILMPQLSIWRARRNAQLRERKRFEAIEMQKIRKTATRRCRNCLNPYRDQNPGAGRFMCSYCGHISKRPVLDPPLQPDLGLSNYGVLKDLVGKGGKIWSDSTWICGQEWLENGNWVGGQFSGNNYEKKSGFGIFSGDDDCMAEKSYFPVVTFACKILSALFWIMRLLWLKVTRFSSLREDSSLDAKQKNLLAKQGENGVNFQESRAEKTRRKAEEKRQARLERELLEEEDRKQREEVARLIEERRKLRDEIMEVEKDRRRGLTTTCAQKDRKKQAEKKRQERKKEKDNSDAEEVEKRGGKEVERKKELHEKNDTERREYVKGNHSRGNAGTHYYLDRVKGTILSSSKAFGSSSSSFFRRGGVNTSSTVSRENKSSISVDHIYSSGNKKDLPQPGKSTVNGDDKNINRPPVTVDPEATSAPKKSWHHLFTGASGPASSNTISKPNISNSKGQGEVESGSPPPPPPLSESTTTYDNPINFGLPAPFTSPNFPQIQTSLSPHDFLPEEFEIFEDPCYIPDPVSLLGPVSESLDNFQLDGFNNGLEKSYALKNISVERPSPIESPLSRARANSSSLCNERHSNNYNLFPRKTKSEEIPSFPGLDVPSSSELEGTYQMWKTSPHLDHQNDLGWLFHPPELNKEETMLLNHHPFSQSSNMAASLFSTKDDEQIHHQGFGTTTFGNSFSPLLLPKPPTTAGPLFNLDVLSPPPNWHNRNEGVRLQQGSSTNHVVGGGLFSPPEMHSLWSFEGENLDRKRD
ncbi:stress response protein NST1-like isoform X2 [Impatiens glandulifera]|uniref:stress response protein NST1-like isoform X2 n=1 Tax=Impatiens glandulifera TaxID=253017 RepID=UPI001FB087E0|nr:stress response protein NST1-like isoform X2 [Impatiens glandulifera]